MLIGIFWALLAGLMLGLYALPAKYTKDFREENTWGLFFMLTMFVVPILATIVIMKGVGNIYGNPEVRAILFLASAASNYMHGTILTVDGGWMGRCSNEFTYGNYYRFFPEMIGQNGGDWQDETQTSRAAGFGGDK